MSDNEIDETAERNNNLLATGALCAALVMSPSYGRDRGLVRVDVIADAEGEVLNVLEVEFTYLSSPYRITVERVTR